MENAVEALKIFLGVTVFAIALTVFFRMTSVAKDTADIVFEAIDETSYINYSADTYYGGNRVVTFQEIIPTIYRYAQEGYGVTIIDKANGNIVARFDLNTESQVSSCFWTDATYVRASETNQRKSNSIKYEMTKYLNENIFTTAGVTQIPLGDEASKETNSDHTELDAIIKRIYYTGNDLNPVYTGWLKSNTYNNNYITQRINCDIYGGSTNFSLINPGMHETDPNKIDGSHRALFSAGLMDKYKDVTGAGSTTFTEYIVEIDYNKYIEDEDGENTGLLIFGTLRETKKREIIYVKN